MDGENHGLNPTNYIKMDDLEVKPTIFGKHPYITSQSRGALHLQAPSTPSLAPRRHVAQPGRINLESQRQGFGHQRYQVIRLPCRKKNRCGVRGVQQWGKKLKVRKGKKIQVELLSWFFFFGGGGKVCGLGVSDRQGLGHIYGFEFECLGGFLHVFFSVPCWTDVKKNTWEISWLEGFLLVKRLDGNTGLKQNS